MTDDATSATITGSFTSAQRTDLLGRSLDDLAVVDGRIDLALEPWEIATLRLYSR
jgi:hypothetical protein